MSRLPVIYEVMCFIISLIYFITHITLYLECRQVIISALISPNNTIYSSFVTAHLHTYYISMHFGNGDKIEMTVISALQRHPIYFIDTQMTEAKCLLCHLRISEDLLCFICLSFQKSVSTLGSLKWQCVCELCRGGMQQTGLEPIGLGRFKGNFTTFWRHGHSFQACVSII